MNMDVELVSLAEAKARLSELTARAAAGEEIVITKRGRPVGRLSRVVTEKRVVDIDQLRQLTRSMVRVSGADSTAVQRLREDARY